VTRARPVRLLQLTDPHLHEDESREISGLDTAATFRAALAKGSAAAFRRATFTGLSIASTVATGAHPRSE